MQRFQEIFQEATDLALLLRSGLPTPLIVVEERTVGPDLGEDSINSNNFINSWFYFSDFIYAV